MLIDSTIVEKEMLPLCGQRIGKIGRAGNMLWLAIGPEVEYVDLIRKSVRTAPKYALDIQTPWRLVSPSEIVVGDSDFYRPSNGKRAPKDWDWDESRNNFFDAKSESLNKLFQDEDIRVIGITADAYGSFSLLLSNQFQLHVFIDSAATEEYWRFFERNSDAPHFVVFDSDDTGVSQKRT